MSNNHKATIASTNSTRGCFQFMIQSRSKNVAKDIGALFSIRYEEQRCNHETIWEEIRKIFSTGITLGSFGRPWSVGSRSNSRQLPELVPGLEFTAIGFGLIPVNPHVTFCPAQEKIWSQGKDYSFSIEIRFKTRTLGGRRQSEIQSSPEDDWIGVAHHIAEHGMNNLGLQQKGGSVGPITN